MRSGPRRGADVFRRSGASLARAGRAAGRAVRKATSSGGAGESGLSRMLELHLLSSAADALIVTALASTIFFAVPTGEARGRVATSLLVTMVPFLVLAPLIGPALDRVRNGRRYALSATMVVRAFLAWVMASAIADGTPAFSLYPAAFGFLVCQKAYLVIRAAALPQVLPRAGQLLGANARMSAAGVIAMVIGGPLGVVITRYVGPEWTLRLAFAVFVGGTVLALALPAHVDSADREDADGLDGGAGDGTDGADHGLDDGTDDRLDDGTDDRTTVDRTTRGRPARSTSLGSRAVVGLRANAALRAHTGFLTLFLAFRLRTDPLPGIEPTTAVALVIAVAALGSGLGTGLGALVQRRRPELVVVVLLALLTAVALWAAIAYGMIAIVAVALVAGLGQALGKLCLDALIQDEVPDTVRTSAFARSETALQLAWVLGGGLGLALPLSGGWGLGIAAVLTGLAAAATAHGVAGLRRPARANPTTR